MNIHEQWIINRTLTYAEEEKLYLLCEIVGLKILDAVRFQQYHKETFPYIKHMEYCNSHIVSASMSAPYLGYNYAIVSYETVIKALEKECGKMREEMEIQASTSGHKSSTQECHEQK